MMHLGDVIFFILGFISFGFLLLCLKGTVDDGFSSNERRIRYQISSVDDDFPDIKNMNSF